MAGKKAKEENAATTQANPSGTCSNRMDTGMKKRGSIWKTKSRHRCEPRLEIQIREQSAWTELAKDRKIDTVGRGNSVE